MQLIRSLLQEVGSKLLAEVEVQTRVMQLLRSLLQEVGSKLLAELVRIKELRLKDLRLELECPLERGKLMQHSRMKELGLSFVAIYGFYLIMY